MTEPAADNQQLPLSTRLYALLRTLQLAIVVMNLFYAALAELLRRSKVTDVSGILPIVAGCAIVESIVVIYVRQSKITQIEVLLRADSEDRQILADLRKWYVIALAFCAGVSLYGFALRIMGASFWLAAIFYVVGIALALYCAPHKPE